MQRNNKKKICIVTSSLGKGGAEKSSALLSIMLSDLGYKVHIVCILNIIDYPFKGEILNLGEFKEKNNSIIGKLKSIWKLYSFLKNEKFDVVIDSRSRPTILKQYFINKIIYGSQNIYYMVRSYKLENYLPKNKYFAKILYKNANKIITVSKAIQNKIEEKYGFKNVETVYNPVDLNASESILEKEITYNEKFVLFYGRLVDSVKNITLLIESYSLSQLPENNINLVVLGDGPDLQKFKTLTKTLGIEEKVQFLPNTRNPITYVKKAVFTLLTSHYEGFPRVLIESLSINTPVIAVNCKSGPSEIIVDKHNGLLVENYNSEALANAMNEFAINEELYSNCKKNAKTSVEKFSVENISKHWEKLIEAE
ncbi:glycosyltransferase [Lacinutrix mariniflava]|uniref:glycosyltransferase n=1 Tax=Lacinutrix mariniflava TaxID=342955 RepID=UPI0006E389DD|nr:glycosyltransferase [Lacinutrix mariniflava]